MHAYLVVGNNTESVTQKVSDLVGKTSQERYEFTIQKIEEVRNLNSFLKLTLPRPTSIVIRDVENATIEALNAFLKNLEEPQKNVRFILTASSEEKVLPTVVSRCQVIKIKYQISNIKYLEKEEEFIKSSIGQKFAFIDKIRQRDEAIAFIKNLIIYLHQKLVTDAKEIGGNGKLASIIKIAQKTLNHLEANGNVGLQLTNFVIQSTGK